MENEMIERVSKAIWISRNSGATDADWIAALAVAKTGYRNTAVHDARWDAIAAIQAMREPTEAMVDAGWAKHGYRGDMTADEYRAMIDAALEPAKQPA